jgi:hypothetical protein
MALTLHGTRASNTDVLTPDFNGAVIQVVQSTIATGATSNSNSYATTGLNLDITPTSSDNKILVSCNFGYSSNTADFGFFAFGVNSTADTNTQITILYQSATNANNSVNFCSLSNLFSPSATSQQNYALFFKCNNASTQSVFFNQRGIGGATGLSTITAMEIVA